MCRVGHLGWVFSYKMNVMLIFVHEKRNKFRPRSKYKHLIKIIEKYTQTTECLQIALNIILRT